MEVFLIRHTTPAIEKGICYGQADIPLAETFSSEWNLLSATLPSGISCIYTSPAKRCVILAEHCAQHYHLSIKIDNRLHEMNFGTWELQPWDLIEPAALNEWMENYKTKKCPQGESYEDVILRAHNFVNDLLFNNNRREEKILVVTHQGFIKAFETVVSGSPPEESMKIKVPYGSFRKYEW